MTPNHRILTREHFAEASALAGEGQMELARDRLRLAAGNALSELAALHGVSTSGDPAAIAARLAEIGVGPSDVGPLLRDLDSAERLEPAFESVQALIDVALDIPGQAVHGEPLLVGAPADASTSTIEAPAVAVAHRVPRGLTVPPGRVGRRGLIVAFATMAVAVSLLAGAISLAAGGASGPEEPRTAGEVPVVR